MIVITGATGQLGQLVVESLLKLNVNPNQIKAAVRTPASATKLGITAVKADYNQAADWDEALQGAERLMLISSSEVGQRIAQHKTVINAAKKAGVKQIVYTSILRADTSPMGLAEEHKATEEAIKASGLSYVILRNGWYTENYLHAVAGAQESGVVAGAAGDGRISSAPRADYALAAATVLTQPIGENSILELAGDKSYTLDELVQTWNSLNNQTLQYKNLEQAQYKERLIEHGLPETFATLLADSDAKAAQGALYDESHQLSHLIQRPTTPLASVIESMQKVS